MSYQAIAKRLRLPTGREVALLDGLKFCYDLSETDAVILFELLRGKEYTVDSLTDLLNLSKATINRGLTKLVELGFVERIREKRSQVGRPRYKYSISNPKRIVSRIMKDFEQCSEAFKNALREAFRELVSKT